MQTVRYSETRGHANLGWLNSRHSFSFGHYYDPGQMGFGTLRVINQDRVAAGAGFDEHGHSNMEIITWVLEGALEHKDSLGSGEVLRPGEIQRMTAGTGIRHSEFNHSKTEPVHFLQIWIVPEKDGLEPGYEQKTVLAGASGELVLVGSREGREGSVTIHQDVDLYSARLDKGGEVGFEVRAGRRVWVQLTSGEIDFDGEALRAGDGIGVTDSGTLSLKGIADADFLLFDLAA